MKSREIALVSELLAAHRPPALTWLTGAPAGSGAGHENGGVDWDAVVAALIDNRTAGLAGRRLKASGAEASVPVAVAEALSRQYRANQFSNTLLLEEAARVLREAASRRVELIPVKGVAALGDLYPDPGDRRLGDLDFLVKPEDAAEAGRVFAGLGYEGESLFKPGSGSQGFRLRRATLTFRIDLSWRLLHRTTVPTRRASAVAELAERAVPAEVAGVAVRTLRREDRMLHTAGHLALHHNLSFAPGRAARCLLAG